MKRASRSTTVGRLVLLGLIVFGGLTPALPAAADVTAGGAQNVQEGDNKNSADQTGNAGSGDAVAGQVAGVVSSGNASLDATNSTVHSDAETGDAESSNDSHSFVGLDAENSCVSTADVSTTCSADVFTVGAQNVQEGDNVLSLDQVATAVTGDAITGEIAGIVAAGGADVVLGNGTAFSDATTGDADFTNTSFSFTGLNVISSCCPIPTDVADAIATTASGAIDS